MEDVVMSSGDGQEGQSKNIRRGQGKSKHCSDPNRKRSSRQTSRSVEPQSVRASGATSTRYGQLQSGRTTTGGILNRLILKAENQLVRINAQLGQLQNEKQELESELEELKVLLNELQARIEENP
jgi:chromosome segregation ATPase